MDDEKMSFRLDSFQAPLQDRLTFLAITDLRMHGIITNVSISMVVFIASRG